MVDRESPGLPEDIDGVISRLEEIIETSAAEQSRLGYFAALDNRVTIAVRNGIRAGSFDDNAQMEELDVAFANRYLEAFDRYKRGEEVTGAWRIAFDAAQREDISVLQHLFLGMNAHIHLDLGIASTDTAAGDPIDSIQRNFHQINDVLASLVPLVEEELGEITHCFSTLQHISHGLEQKVFNFSMVQAREDAWHFAARLSQVADPHEQAALVEERDAETVTFGGLIIRVGKLPKLLHRSHGRDVARHIRILARGEYGLPADVENGKSICISPGSVARCST